MLCRHASERYTSCTFFLLVFLQRQMVPFFCSERKQTGPYWTFFILVAPSVRETKYPPGACPKTAPNPGK